MSITLIAYGPNVTKDNEPHWVWHPCDQEIVAFWCDSCQQQMPNREAAVDHCALPGDHRIARWCDRHGFEAPRPKEQAA